MNLGRRLSCDHLITSYQDETKLIKPQVYFIVHDTLHFLCLNSCVNIKLVSKLVDWGFEPSQPQRTISGLKTNFNLSPCIQSTSHHTIGLFCSFFFFFSFLLNHNSLLKYFTNKPNTTQHTSYFTEHTNLSRKVKIILKISKCKPRDTIVQFF